MIQESLFTIWCNHGVVLWSFLSWTWISSIWNKPYFKGDLYFNLCFNVFLKFKHQSTQTSKQVQTCFRPTSQLRPRCHNLHIKRGFFTKSGSQNQGFFWALLENPSFHILHLTVDITSPRLPGIGRFKDVSSRNLNFVASPAWLLGSHGGPR